MSSAQVKDDWVLDTPREWMTRFKGFSCDIGGSVMKIVYRHKDDWKELEKSTKGRLRFMSVSRSQRLDAIEYLKENCYFEHDIEDKNNPVMVFTTGVGSHQFSKDLNSAFSITAENLSEFDCFVKALTCLVKEVKVSELLYPESADAENEIAIIKKEFTQVFSKEAFDDLSSAEFHFDKNQEQEKTASRPERFDPDSLFPCVLAMCGSGICFMKIEKDGKFMVIDGLNRGGRYFCAVGGFMTDTKTYDELIELAAKGDPNKVHYTDLDMAADTQDKSDSQGDAGGIYGMNPTEDVSRENYIYSMGKGFGKSRGDFSKEDIAACWLSTYCSDVAQALQTACNKYDIKNIFWCGSFIKSDMVRYHLTLEFRRRLMNCTFMTGEVQEGNLYFLRHGPYLGALGCVINSVDQFLRPPSEVAAEKKEKKENEKQEESPPVTKL